MYKLCKTEQSAQRQRRIEDALLDEMLRRPYEEISISGLCDAIQIPRKAFYRYFDSKDAALHALIDHRLMEYELGADPVQFTAQGIQVDFPFYFSFWQTQKQLLDALEQSGLSGILVQRAIQYYQSIQYPDVGAIRSTPEYTDYVINFIVTGMMSLVIQWHHDGYDKDALELAEIARKLMKHLLQDS